MNKDTIAQLRSKIRVDTTHIAGNDEETAAKLADLLAEQEAYDRECDEKEVPLKDRR